MRRSLPSNSTQNVRDEFGTAAYNNNGPNNTANWSGNWTETDDNDNATSGEIQITGGVLDFDGDIDGGETLSRAVNLTGATSATLTFDYVEGNDSGENIVVEAWNGSSSGMSSGRSRAARPMIAARFSGGFPDCSSDRGRLARFGLRTEGDWDTTGTDDFIRIDNVNIAYTTTEGGQTAAFTENGAAVGIASADSLISDVDSANMVLATITLTNAQTGDLLSAGALPGGITVHASSTATNIILTGSATKAAYQMAIEAITFSNSSDTPNVTPRVINVTVNDGSTNSNTAVSTITVTAVERCAGHEPRHGHHQCGSKGAVAIPTAWLLWQTIPTWKAAP